VNAVPGKVPGEYVANITMPEPGEWTVFIFSGFNVSRPVELLPLRAIGAGALNPPKYTPAERGHRLFVAKGCLTCHVHREVEGSGIARVGPDLSEPRLAPAFLEKYLANPAIRPPTGQFPMPNLGLKPNEIAALIAFINREKK
jgi:mono/diheme cytochrome c family protein